MADFNSKYMGEQVDALLDIVSQGGVGGGGGEGEVQKTTEAEITAMGFTKNLGTITEVKMNGVSKGTSGVVDLGTVITEHQDISGKQDKITDLETIRSGAELGATALQSVPSEYVTETELNDKGYATTSALNNKVDKVSGKGLSTEDFTSALKAKLEGLNNYDDTEIENALSTLRGDFDKLVSGDTTTAIKSFNDIIAFLDGIQDTQDLSSIIASIQQQIAGKQDTITDLATIRSGAALGATAVQPSSLAKVATSGSYNDLDDKPTIPDAITESTVSEEWGFTKNTGTITGVSANGTSVATSGVANIPAASTNAYGVTKLSSATNSSSTSLAATASAVKAAYDLANNYKGTVTGVKVNGSTKSPSSGTVDIGNVVTSIKINGSTKTPSNGVVDLGTISGGSSSGESSGGSTTTDKPIELNPSDSLFEITQEGTYILKCTNNKNYEFRVEKKCSIIMGLETGSSYGAITILHPSGMIYWANNNEPVFEDNKMMELSFYPVLTSLGIYSVLGTWASYDAEFVTENYGDYA